jgi:putative ABC transport system permease protein
MLKNYFTIAFRSLLRNKSYTLINIVGLSLGITTCLVIFLLIRHETGFDHFHADLNRIYRVVRESSSSNGVDKSHVVPYPFGEAMRNDFSELKNITQIHYHEDALITIGSEKLNVKSLVFADSMFFDVFSFEALSGNPKKDLAQPGKVFLSEAFANSLLQKDVKHFKVNNMLDLEVAGIIKTPPSATHIKFEMVVSYPSLTSEFFGFPLDQWGMSSSAFTYVKLPEGVRKETVEKRFPAFVKKYYEPEEAAQQAYFLRPLSTSHFDMEYGENPGTAATSISVVYVLALIGLFLLVVGCVNFINLSTALSVKKSKEVGVRKTLGAQQSQLAFQYLSEAFMITTVAAVLSVIIAQVVSPLVGDFLGKTITLDFFHNVPVMIFLAGLVVVTSLFSGFYPALVLSRFNPVKALKSKITDSGSASAVLRKSLVVFQFFIAQVLIICTLVVATQLDFFRHAQMGFNKESVVNVVLPDNDPAVLETFYNKLAANSNIVDVSMAVGSPITTDGINTHLQLSDKGREDQHDISLKIADTHYKNVYGIELLAGTWFPASEDKQPLTAKVRPYVLTASAAKALGFANPKDAIGKNVTSGLYDISGPVIGVMKDFNTASLKSEINPVALIPFSKFYFDAGIKISGNNVPETLRFIETAWQQSFPDHLFQYTFLDEYVAKLYADEARMFTLFQIFAGIAILICCLGLYGLASFMANQKIKEVAIRKTLGASVAHIVGLFSREFVVLVVLAFVIAAPAAAYAMMYWLETFAYRVPLTWHVFAIGMASTLLIAFGTVGYRSLRAALSNPVQALKSE